MPSSRAHDLLSPEGLRIDGRRANELRRISCKLRVHPTADGSALLQIGQTKVLATVYGPHEASKGGKHIAHGQNERMSINVDYRICPYSTSDRKYRPKNDPRLMEMAIYIKKAFEQVLITSINPRSQLDIHLLVLEGDGGTLHTCINAASLALVDAGIPMYDYLCSCSAGFIENSAVLDLSQLEESSAFDIPKFTIAVMPATGKVVLLHLESKMPFDKFELVRNMAVEGSRQIRAVLDEAVRENMKSCVESRLLLKESMATTDNNGIAADIAMDN